MAAHEVGRGVDEYGWPEGAGEDDDNSEEQPADAGAEGVAGARPRRGALRRYSLTIALIPSEDA